MWDWKLGKGGGHDTMSVTAAAAAAAAAAAVDFMTAIACPQQQH
jgi:hypothetical protein